MVDSLAFWSGCKRRGCSSDDCHNAWRRRTVAVIMCGLDSPEPVLFLTFTAPGREKLPNSAAIKRWNADISPRWTRLVRGLRRLVPGRRLEFARVRELQARGAEHVHVLVRGVGFIPHPALKAAAVHAGFGFIVDVRDVTSRKGAASYLGSYLAKSRQTFPPGARVFGTSKGWRIGWTERTPEVGRYISGPPVGISWREWAEADQDRNTTRRLRELRREREVRVERERVERP